MVNLNIMALVIRFSKTGRKGEKKYRIVVREKRSKRDGRPVDIIGHYEKRDKNTIIKDINKEKLQYWIANGAKPTTAVAKII